jgi:hypothetical protein
MIIIITQEDIQDALAARDKKARMAAKIKKVYTPPATGTVSSLSLGCRHGC